MAVLSNIIEALRRIGTPSQRAALRRQDEQLEGREVLSRTRQRVRGSHGVADVFVASVAPSPEEVTVLGEDEVRGIVENVAYGLSMLRALGMSVGEDWTLDDLDLGFEVWLADPRGVTEDAAMELFGAMFGCYCASRLNMRWIKLSDSNGVTLAVDGDEGAFRAFPYQVVLKRIRDRESGFFRPVYVAVEHNAMRARSRECAT